MPSLNWAALVALAPLASPVFAEAVADHSDIIVTAQQVTSDIRSVVHQTPGGVDVIDAQDFASREAVSLRDALAFSPGVYAQPRFGQEVRLSIRGSGISRGFHMRGLTLLQDGIPINLADDNGDFQELDPQIFQHIEVYRGGNALRYGGSTLGGAINAVTPTGRSAPGYQLRVDGGSFDTIRTKASVGFANERGDAFIALTTDNGDGDRDHARRSAIRFNGNVGLRLTDAIETRLYANINHIKQRLPGALYFSTVLSAPETSLPANISGDQQRDIDSVRLQNRTTVDLGAAKLAFGGFFNAKELFHPIYQVVDQKSRDGGLFASVDATSTIAGIPFDVTLGSNVRFGTVAARQYLNIAGHRGAQTADARQKATTVNSYGELRIRPVDGFALVAGGMHIHGERRVDNYRNPNASGRVSYDRFAPKFGILWDAQPNVQFYANYNRSVELPGFIELSQTQAFPVGAIGFVPLKPQRAWTAEIGSRGTLGIVRWDVSIYRADIQGELLQYNAGLTTAIPASTFNADRTRHQGIEATVDLTILPWMRLRQTYQYNDFRFRDDRLYGDNRLPVIAKQLYRAELNLGREAFTVSPNLEWIPQGAWADYANTKKVPGYALIGLTASAQLREGVCVFADVRNITNKKAIGDISAVTGFVTNPNPAIYYPMERRAVYGGVSVKF